MLQKKQRKSDCQNYKKQLVPQHHNTVTCLLNGGIHYVKLGILLDLGTTSCIQSCWLVAQISYRPSFLQHERLRATFSNHGFDATSTQHRPDAQTPDRFFHEYRLFSHPVKVVILRRDRAGYMQHG